MTIGVLSDTHDNLPKIEKAVRFFNKKKVGFVIHAGDFVAPFSIDRLKELKCEWVGVFGNNDGEKNGLILRSAGRIKDQPLKMDLDGRSITAFHDCSAIDIAGLDSDIIICGHTHKPQIQHYPGKMLVNPGECSGWLYNTSTVAVIDTVSLTAKIIRI